MFSRKNITYYLLLCWFIVPFISRAQKSFPALKNFARPVPEPLPPGDIFEPVLSGKAGVDAPVCAEWTRTAGPDESVIITGIKFSAYSDINSGKDTRFTILGSDFLETDAQIQRLDIDKAVITVNKEIPKWSMYLIWPQNENGYGSP